MKKVIAFIAFILFGISTFGQTPAAPAAPQPQSQPLFNVSTQALGIHIGGQTVAGVDEVGSLHVKGGFWLQSDIIQFSSACSTCQSISGQLYVGGPKWYPAFLASKLKGTSLSGIAPYFHGGVGAYRNAPAIGSTTQHFAGMGDAGFDYNVNGTLSIGPRAGLIIAPGAGPTCTATPCPNQNPRGYFISAELQISLAKIIH